MYLTAIICSTIELIIKITGVNFLNYIYEFFSAWITAYKNSRTHGKMENIYRKLDRGGWLPLRTKGTIWGIQSPPDTVNIVFL